MKTRVLILTTLLALPACGQGPPIVFNRGDLVDVPELVEAWVTYQVDSLNVGSEHGNRWRTFAHDWVHSPERFKSRAQLPPEPPLNDSARWLWTERERERICRVCLRHEWQAQRAIMPKPQLSSFDSLKARLQMGVYLSPILGPIEPISPESERAN